MKALFVTKEVTNRKYSFSFKRLFMKVPLLKIFKAATTSNKPFLLLGFVLITLLHSFTASAQNASATWGANGSTAWYTGANWAGGSYAGVQGAAVSNTNIATFTSAFTGTSPGINMNTNSLNLGAIAVENSRVTVLNIGNSSTTASGVLRLYGATVNAVPNVIIRHNGTSSLTLVGTQGGTNMGVVLSNATENIINTDNTGNVTISSIMSGTGKLTKAGSGTGTLTISGVNTYTGGTTINSGTLTFGLASTLPTSGIVALNGGTLRTGNTTGFNQATPGTRTLALTENATLAFGTGSHALAFAASNGVAWTSGKILTVTGWTGTVGAATTGTAGKLIIGTSNTGLTAAQLAQIKFTIGGVDYAAAILASGEIVPVLKYAITSISPTSPTAGSGFDVTVQSQDYNGTVRNVTGATGSAFALGTNGNAGTITGATTGTIASGTSSVTVTGVILTATGSGATITATTTGGDLLSPATSAAFSVGSASTPLLVISGTPTDHGSVCPSTAAATIQYTITNSGGVSATGIDVVSDNPQFVVSNISAATIAASGGSVTYEVTFTPSAAGAQAASITVSSTTSGSNSPISSLTGNGITPVAQAVTTQIAGFISNTTTTLNGTVNALGACPATIEKGFVYAETAVNPNPLDGGTGVTKDVVGGLTPGAFNLPLNGLTPGMQYSFKAYVYDGTIYTYGSALTFTTLTPADHLVFVDVPASGNIASNIAAFTVEARRADNSIDATYTGNVTITKNSGPGVLSGTTTAAAVSGIATFSALQFDMAGTYTLAAASGSLANALSGNIIINLAPVAIFANTITGTNPSSTNPYILGQTFDANITVGGIKRGTGIGVASANDRYSANGWSTGALDANDYFEFTLTPNAGYKIDFNNLVYTGTASGTGPVSFAFRSSVDGFTTNIGTPTATGATIPLSAAAYQNITNQITYRFYAYGANSGTGTFSINDFTFSGNVLCIQPTVFNVTGGATICSSGTGTPIGLSGSQSGVSYQLKVNDTNTGAPVAGTGNALSFGNQTAAGTYTVEATNINGGCNYTLAMTGNATVVVDTAPVGGTINGSATACSGGNSGTLTLVDYTGTIVKWQSSPVSDFSLDVTDIAVTIATLNYTNVAETTYYRAELSGGICGSVYSASALITVQTNTWTGTNSTLWNDAGNWSCGVIPTPFMDITITAVPNQPIVDFDVTVNSLTMEASTSLTVQTGYDLTITDALNVNIDATVTIENDANLIQVNASNNNTGNIIVNRSSAALMRSDYTIWSAPVAGQNLLDFSPATLATRFYTYNPVTDLYNAIVPSTNDFEPGTGYLIRMPNNHPTTPTVWEGTFEGSPNNGNVNIPVTSGTFNAVGNPYPSTISADAFITENNITAALYFWRKTNNELTTSYATYTLAGGAGTGSNSGGDPLLLVPNGTIQVGQGFIAKSTSTNLAFTNLMRTGNNAGQFLRTAEEVERNRFWLNLTNTEGVFSQTMVSYMTGATSGIDAAIDGLYFNDSQIALTSIIGNAEYAIQGRALPFEGTDVVPLGFKVISAGNYTIGLDHFDGLFENEAQAILLKDNLTGLTHDLRTGAYSFSSEAGVFNSRFEIIYQSTLGTTNPVWTANQVVVYKQGAELVINTGKIEMAKVQLFDIRGRLLIEKDNVNAFETKINAGLTNQVLIIKITSDDHREVTKKVVN